MKSNLTPRQKQALEALDLLDEPVTAEWWAPADNPGGARLYFQTGRRDAKVFVVFDHADLVTGAKLKVQIRDCGQSQNWYRTQGQRLAKNFFEAFIVVAALGDTEKQARMLIEYNNTPEEKRCADVEVEVR